MHGTMNVKSIKYCSRLPSGKEMQLQKNYTER